MYIFWEYRCQQCGACLRIHPLVDDFSICKYCNTVYQTEKNGKIKKYDTKKVSQDLESILSSLETQKRTEIMEEIEFLKKQFEITRHNSIPMKIEKLEKNSVHPSQKGESKNEQSSN